MGVVSQEKPLTMGWCLDCHRNPEKNIVGARPISGVFTGAMHDVKDLMDSTYIYTSIEAQVHRTESLTSPSFGGYQAALPAHTVQGIPHPKKAGLGPENCGTCHY